MDALRLRSDVITSTKILSPCRTSWSDTREPLSLSHTHTHTLSLTHTLSDLLEDVRVGLDVVADGRLAEVAPRHLKRARV